jgi:hypothetical protein
LKAIDRKIEEEDIVIITLKIILYSYENFVETINIISGDVDLTVEQLNNKLL